MDHLSLGTFIVHLVCEPKILLSFYYDLMSQPSRALYIILKIGGIRFRDCPVGLRNGNNENTKFHRYLSAEGKIPEYLYQKYFIEQAHVNEFFEWQYITLCSGYAVYFRRIWLDPLLGGMADYDVRIRTWLKRIHAACNPHYDYAHQFVYKISGIAQNSKL
uniref:GST N-terminal domain-containing protein n=1 Tax=Glossina palpalis gambiensis TaxID=67801 RepID=A0A1B0ANH0_9MUSC